MGLDLRGWWLREMVATPSPLTERMTLFWHNHFVSAQPKGALHAVDVSAERALVAIAVGTRAAAALRAVEVIS